MTDVTKYMTLLKNQGDLTLFQEITKGEGVANVDDPQFYAYLILGYVEANFDDLRVEIFENEDHVKIRGKRNDEVVWKLKLTGYEEALA